MIRTTLRGAAASNSSTGEIYGPIPGEGYVSLDRLNAYQEANRAQYAQQSAALKTYGEMFNASKGAIGLPQLNAAGNVIMPGAGAVATYIPPEAAPKVTAPAPMIYNGYYQAPPSADAPDAGSSFLPESLANLPSWAKYAAAGALVVFLMSGSRGR